MKKSVITLSCLGCLGFLALNSNAIFAKSNDGKTYKGYTLVDCQVDGSYQLNRNYCTTHKDEIGKVIESANQLKEPNFDKNKKVVQLFYRGGQDYETKDGKIPMSDIFVVDDNRKKIYLSPLPVQFFENSDEAKKYPYAPRAYTKKSSNWICLNENDGHFAPLEEDDNYITFRETSTQESILACVHFYDDVFHTPTFVNGGFDETKNIKPPYVQ